MILILSIIFNLSYVLAFPSTLFGNYKLTSIKSFKNGELSVADSIKNMNDTFLQQKEKFLKTETWAETFNDLFDMLKMKSNSLNLVLLCDKIDNSIPNSRQSAILDFTRRRVLVDMLSTDRNEYIESVRFLGPRIPRADLPNVQDIPISCSATSMLASDVLADCTLPNQTYPESILDTILLSIFRGLVQKEIKWKSDTPGIPGLLDEGRHFMLSANGTAENQHTFVRNTLAGLMTPILPPFYRIFMSGIIPSRERGDPNWLVEASDTVINNLPKFIQSKITPGKQLGPWFYAPFLTSFVTPTFLNFLVGPSKPNRRKDGQLGGLLVEKCKFLQESGCKGLCLHQCKLPAQQFFASELGLQLTVSPNFETQECQWSWGEAPLPVDLDPSFPSGCLAGCPTRGLVKKADNGDIKATLLSSCNSS